jgi:hypothetical protein
MKNLKTLVAVLLLIALGAAAGFLAARLGVGSRVATVDLPSVERQFAERMQNVALIGSFTVSGGEDRGPREDRYDISSVEKVGDDQWRFNAKIGELGVTLPVVVTMKFVGDTPMITITDLTIPTLGTFTARVFFYGDRYAGTWQHGARGGGHMFGRIEKR